MILRRVVELAEVYRNTPRYTNILADISQFQTHGWTIDYVTTTRDQDGYIMHYYHMSIEEFKTIKANKN